MQFIYIDGYSWRKVVKDGVLVFCKDKKDFGCVLSSENLYFVERCFFDVGDIEIIVQGKCRYYKLKVMVKMVNIQNCGF